MPEQPLTPEEQAQIGTVFDSRWVLIDAKLYYRFDQQAKAIGMPVGRYVDRILSLSLKSVPEIERLVAKAAEHDAVEEANTDFFQELFNEEIPKRGEDNYADGEIIESEER